MTISLNQLLNLGMPDPLTLSMAHPVTDRVGKLGRKPLRFGGVFAVIISIPVLISTAVAADEKPYDFTPNVMNIHAYWIGDGTDLSLADRTKEFVIDFTQDRELRITSTDPKFELNTPRGDETFPNLFAPAVRQCSEHAQGSKTPIYFKSELPDRLEGVHAGQYLMRCIPGTPDNRRALTIGDLTAALGTSPDFTDTQKSALRTSLRLNR